MEAIAARYGALVVYGPVATSRGAIVGAAGRAVIWIDEQARGEPRADFTGAHELGHHRLHRVVDHFEQCYGEESAPPKGSPEAREAEKTKRAVEREANHFATELLMPERWARDLCDHPRPSLDDVHRLSRRFRTSFHASALRFIELTRAPCAFVYSVGGRIKRSTETESFPGRIVQTRALHAGSVAARLQGAPAGAESGACEVGGDVWGDAGGAGFVEEAVPLGPGVGVMSWISAIA